MQQIIRHKILTFKSRGSSTGVRVDNQAGTSPSESWTHTNRHTKTSTEQCLAKYCLKQNKTKQKCRKKQKTSKPKTNQNKYIEY